MNLSKILRHKSLGKISTTIGELYLFIITVGEARKLKDDINSSIEDCPPEKYVRLLIKYTCFRLEQLENGECKPLDDPQYLSEAELEKLSSKDLENFAEVFLSRKENYYLYKKKISKEEKKEDGTLCVSLEYGDVEKPKRDNESYVEYLHRLEVIKEKEDNERYEKIFGSIKGLNSFPGSVVKDIKNSYILGDSISSRIGDAASAVKPVSSPFNGIFNSPTIGGVSEILKKYGDKKGILDTKKVSNINITEEVDKLYKQEQVAREVPFKRLGMKLDNLIEISKDMLNFTNSVNKTQIEMSASINKSAKDASSYAKASIFIAILLAVVSMLVGQCSSKKNDKALLDTQKVANSAVEELKAIKEELQKISESQNSKMTPEKLKTIDEVKLIKKQENINNKEINKVGVDQQKKVLNKTSNKNHIKNKKSKSLKTKK